MSGSRAVGASLISGARVGFAKQPETQADGVDLRLAIKRALLEGAFDCIDTPRLIGAMLHKPAFHPLFGGAPQNLHNLYPGLMVCPQYAQGWDLSEAPHFGHQTNSGVIAIPQVGQGSCEETALTFGIGAACPAGLAASGISNRVKLQPHMETLSL